MARLPLLRMLSLAVRQLLRDARAGELRVLFFALLVAVVRWLHRREARDLRRSKPLIRNDRRR